MTTPTGGTNPAAPATPAKQKTINPYTQPIFDARITNLPRPFLGQYGTAIRRGFMVWDKALTPPGSTYNQNQPAQVNFLFNPSTISTSYQIISGSAQAALNYSSTQGISDGALLLPIQQQASFTIMFDRTYELNDGPTLAKYPNIANFGVDVDIAALKQYTGMFANIYKGNANYNPYSPTGSASSSASGSGGGGGGNGTAPKNSTQTSNFNSPIGTTLSQGVMQVTIGYCYFGGLNTQTGDNGSTTTQGGLQAQGITYYGYIDSWSVEYTHFTQFMVPMRAVVDISWTFLPAPSNAPDSKGASAISKTLSTLSQAQAQQLAGELKAGFAAEATNPAAGIAGR